MLQHMLWTIVSLSVFAGSVQDSPDRPALESPQSAEALLERLEEDGRTLHDFRAKVNLRKYDDLMQETECFVGNVVYRYDSDRSHPKRFAILFDRKGTLPVLHERNEHYIFDGEWFAERMPDEKQLIRRQVVAPGEDIDPLRIGEGPFPMPIGQTRADVLEHFAVELIEPPTEADPGGDSADAAFFAKYLNLTPDVWGIAMTPKPGTPASEDYTRLDLFYDAQTLLPAGIRTLKPGGNREFVLFLNRERNTGIDEAIFDTLPPDRTWRFSQTEWGDPIGDRE